MKNTKKIILLISIVFTVFALIGVVLIFIICYDNSKVYVDVINSNTAVLYENFYSDYYDFEGYCKKYNLPEKGEIYLSGTLLSYEDIIIEANEYCDQDVNIRNKPSGVNSSVHHWTIKIIDGIISEVWLHKSPLEKEMLTEYDFSEQVAMIPLLKKDRLDYAIGYYKNEDEAT